MNKWVFTGNLGKDAEQKFLPNGTALLSFTVAVKSGYGDKAKTTWVSCGLFGKRAEGQLAQYLVKGAQVCISGEAFIDEWEKDGHKNKMLKVNVDDLDLIGGKQDDKPQQQGGGYSQQPQQQQPQRQQQHQGGYGQQQQQSQNQQQQQQQPRNQQLPAGDWDDSIPF